MADKKQSRIVVVQGKLPTILAQAGITLTLHDLAHAQFRFYPDGWGDTLVYGGHITGYEICEDTIRLFIATIQVSGNKEGCLTCYIGPETKAPAWKLGADKYSRFKKGVLELFV